MEASIGMRIQFQNEGVATQSRCFFEPEHRPVFEEDLEPALQPAFQYLEFIEAPAEMHCKTESIFIFWGVLSDYQSYIEDVCKGMAAIGAISITGIVVLDEDYSAKFTYENGKLKNKRLKEEVYETSSALFFKLLE